MSTPQSKATTINKMLKETELDTRKRLERMFTEWLFELTLGPNDTTKVAVDEATGIVSAIVSRGYNGKALTYSGDAEHLWSEYEARKSRARKKAALMDSRARSKAALMGNFYSQVYTDTDAAISHLMSKTVSYDSYRVTVSPDGFNKHTLTLLRFADVDDAIEHQMKHGGMVKEYGGCAFWVPA